MGSLAETFRPGSRYQAFFGSLATFGLAYGLYKGVLDNYLAEIVEMSEMGRGVSEFFRELPGLALVFLLAAFYMMSAERIYKMGAMIMLMGMVLHAVLPAHKVLATAAICCLLYTSPSPRD